ncbi:MAG TPA: TrmH family RNA methyltransferase [Gemmatimonadaceae bacterium]|nr:TrmH family RNA methyltransferase [Gemmatimonadaceae bacterium]
MGSILDNISVVLHQPQNPINIGATVRAMANMGLGQLRLVQPVAYDVAKIEGIAHGTRERIAKIAHFDTLQAAVADCSLVHAYAGKPRAARWTRLDPKSSAAALLAAAETAPVAIVFGPEDHGLENDALDLAHATVTIPTTAAHMSLNLAQAVLLAAYELHVASADATRSLRRHKHNAPAASQEQLERTFSTFAKALDAIDFFKTRNPELVMRSVRSLVFRAAPDAREADLARAVAIEVMRTIDRIQGVYRGGYGKPDSERS